MQDSVEIVLWFHYMVYLLFLETRFSKTLKDLNYSRELDSPFCSQMKSTRFKTDMSAPTHSVNFQHILSWPYKLLKVQDFSCRKALQNMLDKVNTYKDDVSHDKSHDLSQLMEFNFCTLAVNSIAIISLNSVCHSFSTSPYHLFPPYPHPTVYLPYPRYPCKEYSRLLT